MSILCLEHFAAGYGGNTVLRDISFALQSGEFCALLGLNGSGKTTLLKSICGLLPPQAGRCLINGTDCTRQNERKRARNVSYIPQRFSKLIGVTVLDAVMMGFHAKLGLLEFPSARDKALAMATLARMGIADLASADFSRLSEGQKQTVILARALVQDASIMLMDEPDSALDFIGRNRALSKIRQLIHDENKAGLVTLHDPSLALAYCDRLILLHEGGVLSDINVAASSTGELQECLSAIYGGISLIEHNGRYLALYEE